MWNPMSVRGTGVFVAVLVVAMAQGPMTADPAVAESSDSETRTERPSYEVVRTSAPIQVDGRLSEPAWEGAEEFAFFNNVPAVFDCPLWRSGDPRPARSDHCGVDSAGWSLETSSLAVARYWPSSGACSRRRGGPGRGFATDELEGGEGLIQNTDPG